MGVNGLVTLIDRPISGLFQALLIAVDHAHINDFLSDHICKMGFDLVRYGFILDGLGIRFSRQSFVSQLLVSCWQGHYMELFETLTSILVDIILIDEQPGFVI